MEELWAIIRSYLGGIYLPEIKWTDVLDILVIAYILYHLLLWIKTSQAWTLLKGILVLALFMLIAELANLNTILWIARNLVNVFLLALVILFQPELRRILEKLGRARFTQFALFAGNEDEEKINRTRNCIDAVCEASMELSSTCTGALIIFERKTKLGEQIATGTVLNCTPSAAVFGNIFFPNTPLHDGAVVIRDGMILAAGCFLPKPQKEELIAKQLGSRHRAAIGMSENSDAIVIVVSEETGTISVAENGELTRGFNRDSLRKMLMNRMLPEQAEHPEKESSFAGRFVSKWKK